MNHAYKFFFIALAYSIGCYASQAGPAQAAEQSQLIIQNITTTPLFIAVYNEQAPFTRVAAVVEIQPGNRATIPLPKKIIKEAGGYIYRTTYYAQYLMVARSAAMLASTLEPKNVSEMQKKAGSFALTEITNLAYAVYEIKQQLIIRTPTASQQTRLTNYTKKPVYVAIYCTAGTTSDIFSDIMKVEPETEFMINIPAQEAALECTRELFYAYDPRALQPQLSEKEIIAYGTQLARRNLDELYTWDFTFYDAGDMLEAYTYAEWTKSGIQTRASAIVSPLQQAVSAAATYSIERLKRGSKELLETHHFKNKTATVALQGLWEPEQKFIGARQPTIKPAVSKIIGKELSAQEIPNIAWCCSGGGYRAMIATLGALQGATEWKRSGGLIARSIPCSLIDATSYIAGLSGSTWALASWIHRDGMAPSEVIKQLATKLDKPLTEFSPIAGIDVGGVLLKNYVLEKPQSIIELYGALLAAKLLPTSYATLPDQISLVNKHHMPLPIYTTIVDQHDRAQEQQKKYGIVWCELTPYATTLIDTVYLAVPPVDTPFVSPAIETWALGRKFSKGTSLAQDNTPPPTTGFVMGMCGSAFSVNFQEIWQKLRPNISSALALYLETQGWQRAPATLASSIIDNGIIASYDETIDQLMKEYKSAARLRALPAQVPNWTLNIPKVEFNEQQLLTLIDAGIDFNFPLPSLLQKERKVNIILMLDCGTNAPDLKQAELYARVHGYKFPKIPDNYKEILAQEFCTLFQEADPEIPTVIYIQAVKAQPGYMRGKDLLKEPFTATQNFVYSAEQVMQLSGLAAYTMQQSQPIITKAIEQWLELRKKKQQRESQGDRKLAVAKRTNHQTDATV